MRNLEKIIIEYLSKQTDYAVQIVGSWGYGKTYYYRNNLVPIISSKEICRNNTKKYKPIYISLFGLKSIEDLATKIVLEFYQSQLFKKYSRTNVGEKRLRITQSVVKIVLRGLLNIKVLGNLNEYLTDIKDIGENALNTDELVICFDDIERKDTSLHIEDLTGYINSLVDEKVKVLIISNEDLLLKAGDQYRNLKEKIIGITVEFVPNAKDTLQSIIKNRYAGFSLYEKYLNDNLDLLIKITNSINNNFRHVIYALDTLHHCYSEIKNNILDPQHEIHEKVQEQLNNISTLTLALAVEYKSSAIKYSDLNDYQNGLLFFLDEMISENPNTTPKENNKTKYQVLIEKYSINKTDYHFFKTIYNYITGYDEFDINSFISEFRKKFNLEKGKVLPQYELLNILSYQNCFNLSDDEYKEKTLALLDYAKNGEFDAVNYLTIMSYAERLNNILNLDLEEVRDNLIIGLKKSIANEELSFSQFEDSKRAEISKLEEQLYKAGIKEIELFEQKRMKEKSKEIADLLMSDPAKFRIQYYSNNDFRNNLSYYSIIKYLNPEKFLEKVESFDYQVLQFLKHFFTDRYKKPELLKEEFDNFSKLTALLNTYLNEIEVQEKSKIRTYIISKLVEPLNDIINKGQMSVQPLTDSNLENI